MNVPNVLHFKCFMTFFESTIWKYRRIIVEIFVWFGNILFVFRFLYPFRYQVAKENFEFTNWTTIFDWIENRHHNTAEWRNVVLFYFLYVHSLGDSTHWEMKNELMINHWKCAAFAKPQHYFPENVAARRRWKYISLQIRMNSYVCIWFNAIVLWIGTAIGVIIDCCHLWQWKTIANASN